MGKTLTSANSTKHYNTVGYNATHQVLITPQNYSLTYLKHLKNDFSTQDMYRHTHTHIYSKYLFNLVKLETLFIYLLILILM